VFSRAFVLLHYQERHAEVYIWTKDRHILKVAPADGPANGVSTCVKGKFAWDFVNSKDRLTKPLIREGDHFREAEWDEALDLVARRFQEIKGLYGPDALAFIASSKCTNEEAYLMQKLARADIVSSATPLPSTVMASAAEPSSIATAPSPRRWFALNGTSVLEYFLKPAASIVIVTRRARGA
jgi:predicted molibdopterin-dependent oxidoreductase YjgC